MCLGVRVPAPTGLERVHEALGGLSEDVYRHVCGARYVTKEKEDVVVSLFQFLNTVTRLAASVNLTLRAYKEAGWLWSDQRSDQIERLKTARHPTWLDSAGQVLHAVGCPAVLPVVGRVGAVLDKHRADDPPEEEEVEPCEEMPTDASPTLHDLLEEEFSRSRIPMSIP